jgi:hypothetical protein
MVPYLIGDFSLKFINKVFSLTKFIHDDLVIKDSYDYEQNWTPDDESMPCVQDVHISL